MEALIKLQITDYREEDWLYGEYANYKFEYLPDEHIMVMIGEIISDTIEDNGMYHDFDDADRATQRILPMISSIVLSPHAYHIRMSYDLLVEMVTYLTLRLA